nr:MAG TPA: hypothetical protein [Caudoviricetes sp.]
MASSLQKQMSGTLYSMGILTYLYLITHQCIKLLATS